MSVPYTYQMTEDMNSLKAEEFGMHIHIAVGKIRHMIAAVDKDDMPEICYNLLRVAGKGTEDLQHYIDNRVFTALDAKREELAVQFGDGTPYDRLPDSTQKAIDAIITSATA